MATRIELRQPGSFRLCANPAYDNHAARRLRRVIEAVAHGMTGFAPLGLILVGSAARGEALIMLAGRRRRWLSDLQCLIVVAEPPRRRPDLLDAALADVATRLESEARSGDEALRIRLSAVAASALAASGPTLFACELAAHGKLVWGRPDTIALPNWPPDADAPDPREAFRLLNRRILEQVALRMRYADGWADAVEAGYGLGKYWTELATSLALHLGCYQPDLRERMLAVEAALVARAETRAAVVGNGLLRKLDDAARVRLGKLDPARWPCDEDFDDSARFAESLWHLESAELAAAPGNEDGDDWRTVARRMRRAAGVGQRVRDWSHWLFAADGGRELMHAAAALGAGSPTNAIYAAGCLLHFYWSQLGAGSANAELARALRAAFDARAAWGAPLRRELAARTLAASDRFLGSPQ